MAKKEEKKTNAMHFLDAKGIQYTMHTYDASDGHIDGLAVAEKCNEDPDMVFKTLVTKGDDRNYYVFVVGVRDELDLKACARSVGVKSVEMVQVKELLGLTGYVRGGCSPIGMKKQFQTVYDETIELFETVLVSGGRIGTQIEISPKELIAITNGKIAQIAK